MMVAFNILIGGVRYSRAIYGLTVIYKVAIAF